MTMFITVRSYHPARLMEFELARPRQYQHYPYQEGSCQILRILNEGKLVTG